MKIELKKITVGDLSKGYQRLNRNIYNEIYIKVLG